MRNLFSQRKGLAVLLLAGLIFQSGILTAQNEVPADLSALEKRMQTLEKAMNAQYKPVVSALADNRIGFLLHLRATYDQTPGVKDEFKGRRGEISLSGSPLPNKIHYKIMIDPISLSNKIVQDAYISLTYVKFADLQFGQFKFPQGLEARGSSSDLDFIDRSVVSTQFGDKRDFGVQVGASQIPMGPLKADYALCIVNGSGRNNPEDNDNKDFAGRTGIQFGSIWLGASGYFGRQPTGERSRIGGEMRLVYKNIKLQGEYIYGKTEKAAVGPSTPQQGYYAFLSYPWKIFRPALRWESWDPDLDSANNRQDALTGGIDIFLTENQKNKIEVNYMKNYRNGISLPNDQAMVQLQVAF